MLLDAGGATYYRLHIECTSMATSAPMHPVAVDQTVPYYQSTYMYHVAHIDMHVRAERVIVNIGDLGSAVFVSVG